MLEFLLFNRAVNFTFIRMLVLTLLLLDSNSLALLLTLLNLTWTIFSRFSSLRNCTLALLLSKTTWLTLAPNFLTLLHNLTFITSPLPLRQVILEQILLLLLHSESTLEWPISLLTHSISHISLLNLLQLFRVHNLAFFIYLRMKCIFFIPCLV